MVAPRQVIGLRFGKLVGVSECAPARRKSGRSMRVILCRCDCGRNKKVRADSLFNGDTRSCGCLLQHKEKVKHGHTRRGQPKHALYHTWTGMKARCSNPKNMDWKSYGGRGIRVCREWSESFAQFLSDMGEKPSPEMTLDRINVHGSYEPSNCRWATPLEQAANKRVPTFWKVRS